jgi:hypothetical protein
MLPNRIAEALVHFDADLRPFPRTPIYFNRFMYEANRCMSVEPRSEAAAVLDRALALYPGFPPARLYKATICERSGRSVEARELLRRMQRSDPQATLPMWEMIILRIYGHSPMLGELLGKLRAFWVYAESAA